MVVLDPVRIPRPNFQVAPIGQLNAPPGCDMLKARGLQRTCDGPAFEIIPAVATLTQPMTAGGRLDALGAAGRMP
jgi:hypothetical protein